MSIQSSESRLTPYQLKPSDYLKLIGATPKEFCHITRPQECRAADASTVAKCQEIFRQCVWDATQFENWHRAN
ncbi:MAG: hypothetical protein KBD36_06275 [Alphaproteobacteria bacterium]|nr:hypothetical protein [Alphaproteobacteria bacterium]